jgi:predicted ATPase
MQGALLIAARGYAAPEVGQTYNRARELCEQVGQPAQLLHTLWGLYTFHMMRAEVETAQDLGGEIYTLVQAVSDPTLLVNAYLALGATAFHRGEFERAREYLACGAALPSPPLQTYSLTQSAQDPWGLCLGYEAMTLSPLGYPDQARERLAQTFRGAQALEHPFSLASCHEGYCHIAHCYREPHVVAEHAEAMVALATEHGFQQRLANGLTYRGWALAQQQQTEDGIEQIRRGIAAYQAAGISLMLPYFLGFLAEAALRGHQITEGLATVTEALERTHRTGERFSEAELYRLKGELLLTQEDKSQKAKGKAQKSKVPNPIPQIPDSNSEAETCFLKAIEIARKQSAKLLELRATVSLSRLWQQKGKKKKEAHKMLADIYNWFTEGFDTKDLQEAKALLEELA